MLLKDHFIELPFINEDYKLIQNEYASTTIYTEVVHFLQLAYPEWNCNKGLGAGAPEFVLQLINEHEETFYTKPQREALVSLYLDASDSYELSQKHFFSDLMSRLETEFFMMDEEDFASLYNKEINEISQKEYTALLELYKQSHMNLIPFTFDF